MQKFRYLFISIVTVFLLVGCNSQLLEEKAKEVSNFYLQFSDFGGYIGGILDISAFVEIYRRKKKIYRRLSDYIGEKLKISAFPKKPPSTRGRFTGFPQTLKVIT